MHITEKAATGMNVTANVLLLLILMRARSRARVLPFEGEIPSAAIPAHCRRCGCMVIAG
ncbi:MAG: hypothetical protein JWR26_2488 [Pedosphaera sp.]|nr:hypothetical protein [Pedosphaera sp.]